MEQLIDDIRHGLRVLRKTPGWTLVVATTIALGIGLTTAIFSIVYGVLLQPLPYPQPGRLVALWTTAPQRGMPKLNVGAANWRDWRAQSQSFEDIALTRPIANFNLTGSGTPERLQGARTSWNLPQVLGVKPMVGRVFTEEEQTRGADVAVLSYGLWERRFGRDHGLIGRTIQLNGTAFEVIGVMPPEYRYPSREFELWTPLYIRPDEIQLRLGYDYIAVGRLKPGITTEQAQAEMSTIMRRLGEQYPEIDRTFNTKLGVLVEPLIESTVGQVRTTLYLLFAAVGCLLLTGCVNLANLLLARANARTREIAVMPFLPPRMPRVEAIGLNAPVVLFAIALSVLVILVAGLLPARRAAHVDLNKSLRQDSRTRSGSSEIRNVLVVTQVAVSLALLFGSGLLVRSLQTLLHVNPGFTTQGVLTTHLAMTRAKYPKDADVAAYCRRHGESAPAQWRRSDGPG